MRVSAILLIAIILKTYFSLDYLFLWSFVVGASKYFLQIEDDVVANVGYLDHIDHKLKTRAGKNWLALEFSSLGFIGKLFHEKTLRDLILFTTLLFKDKPIDLIYLSFQNSKICLPDWDNKKCGTEIVCSLGRVIL